MRIFNFLIRGEKSSQRGAKIDKYAVTQASLELQRSNFVCSDIYPNCEYLVSYIITVKCLYHNYLGTTMKKDSLFKMILSLLFRPSHKRLYLRTRTTTNYRVSQKSLHSWDKKIFTVIVPLILSSRTEHLDEVFLVAVYWKKFPRLHACSDKPIPGLLSKNIFCRHCHLLHTPCNALAVAGVGGNN